MREIKREEKVFSDSIEFNWKAAQNATGYNVYLKDEAKKEAVKNQSG